MDYNLSNKTFQFMLLQNKAYHEENLSNLKPSIDNKLIDYSHILDNKNPSRRHYLEREKEKDLQAKNENLYIKISSIAGEKVNKSYRLELPPIRNSIGGNMNSPSKFYTPKDQLHIHSKDFNTRKKEYFRIDDDNRILLHKLQNTKPIINSEELKQHARNSKKLSERLRSYDKHNRLKSVLYIHDRDKLNPILNKFISRHENIESKPVTNESGKKTKTKVKRSNSQNNFDSLTDHDNSNIHQDVHRTKPRSLSLKVKDRLEFGGNNNNNSEMGDDNAIGEGGEGRGRGGSVNVSVDQLINQSFRKNENLKGKLGSKGKYNKRLLLKPIQSQQQQEKQHEEEQQERNERKDKQEHQEKQEKQEKLERKEKQERQEGQQRQQKQEKQQEEQNQQQQQQKNEEKQQQEQEQQLQQQNKKQQQQVEQQQEKQQEEQQQQHDDPIDNDKEKSEYHT